MYARQEKSANLSALELAKTSEIGEMEEGYEQ